jgi:hypothetical protein
MSKKRIYRLSIGDVVDVEEQSINQVLEVDPKAEEVKSFTIDKDTFDVALPSVEAFLKEAPNAKPLFEDEPTKDFTKQIADVKSFDMVEEVGSMPQVELYSGLNDNDKTAITKTFSMMPINVLGTRKSREVFYNSYAKSRDLDPKILREYGERAAAESMLVKGDELAAKGDVKGAEQLYLSQVGNRGKDSLKRLSDLYKSQGRDEEAAQLLEQSNQVAFEKLPQVGSGSYKQPTYQPTTLGASGKQGFTIEGDTKEITPDTEETASSKYLKEIRDVVAGPTDWYGEKVIKPSGEMIKAGGEKLERGMLMGMSGSPISGGVNQLFGLVEGFLGAAGIGTLGGQVFIAALTEGSERAPEVVEKALWGTHILAPYLKDKWGLSEDMANNVGLTADIGTAMLLHIGLKKAKGEITKAKNIQEAFNEIDETELKKIVDESVKKYESFNGDKVAYQESLKNELGGTVAELKELSEIESGKQEVALQEPIRANNLLEIPEGTNVEFTTKNGKESGIIDRLDDGTWIFENENGTTEIPVKDKTNPIETLQELGIDIVPEVPPDQLAKAMADREMTGWVTETKGDKTKTYFVSLGNPKIEGSYDLVFEQNSKGGLTSRFDSSADPVFAESRKLKLINKLLEQESKKRGVNLPKRDKVLQPPIKAVEPKPTVEAKPTETVEVKPIEEVKPVEETKPTVVEETVVEDPTVEQQPIAEEQPIVEAEQPPIESTKTEPVSEVKVEEPIQELPKDETKGSLLNDVRRFNSLSKKDRQTVGAKLKAKIMEGASKIDHSVSYDNKGKLILLNKEGKRAKASPTKISEEAKQANKVRVESARKALAKQPSTLREWILQFLLSKGSISAKDLNRATGFKTKEFPAFTVGEKGTTFHDLMEMIQGDTELNHILKDYTQDGFFDNQKFDSDVAEVMTSIQDRKAMWEELMGGNAESAWRDQGFSSKANYEYALELQAEADRLGIDIEDVKESHIAEAENITKYMEEEDIVKMLQDLDENAPQTIEEINKFYEDNNIEQAEISSETSSPSSVKGEVIAAEEKLEKAKQDLKNKRKQLLETLLEDNENLFGEKKSAEGKLFDEKADATKMEEALTPLKEKVKEAELELEEAKKSTVIEDNQTSITSDVGKDVEFNHAGQDRIGTIVGEEGNNYVIESEVGNRKNTYTYPKDKATIIETTPEESLQSRRNLTNIGSANGLAFQVPSNFPEKAIKFIKKMFNNTAQLPKNIFNLKVKMEGEKAANMTDIKRTINTFNSTVKKTYNQKLSKVPASEFVKMDKYLKGDKSVALDAEIKLVLDDMRLQIDKLSRELINEGLVDGDLSLKISQNEGVYVTRTYRVFDDPKWAEKVPEQIKNRAKAYLRSENPNATPAQIDGIINSLLYEKDAPIQLLAQGKVGSMDLGILKKRKEIPLELRQLMGEYNDPIVNYAKSVYKINAMLEHSKFLKDVYNEGLNKFLFEQREGDYFVKIAADNSKSYDPLGGLYTTPELAEAFTQVRSSINGTDLTGSAFKAYMTVNAAVKAGKTIGSIQNHVRNVVSNINFLVANGNILQPKNAKVAWDTVRTMWKDSGTDAQIEYVKKLQRLGILDEGANAMEMRETIKDAAGKYDDIDTYLNNNILSKVKKGTVKAYALEDAMFKVFAFESEKAKYQKIGFTPEQAEARAAEIVRLTMPTYSLIPEVVKQIRKFPLVGTFVSFPAEVIRTYANTWQLAIRETKDPITRKIGIQRMAGLITATVLTKAVASYSKYLWNVSTEEEKALRRMQPPWSATSDYVYVGRDKNGVPIYVDLGYVDPYNYLKNPVNSILFADDPKEGAIDAFYKILQPYISEEMLSGRLMDIRSNKNQTGGKIYNEQEPLGDQLSKIYEYMGSVAEPGTITSIRRIYKGYKGETSSYGKQYDIDNEIIATLTGQRIANTNVASNFGFKSFQFASNMSEGKKIYNTAVYKTKDLQQMDYSYNTANDASEKIYNEYKKDYQAALKLGVSKEELNGIMEQNNIGFTMRKSIENNAPYSNFPQRSANEATLILDKQGKGEFLKYMYKLKDQKSITSEFMVDLKKQDSTAYKIYMDAISKLNK